MGKNKQSIDMDSIPFQIQPANGSVILPNFINTVDFSNLVDVYGSRELITEEQFIKTIRYQFKQLVQFVLNDNNPNTIVDFTKIEFLLLFEKAIMTMNKPADNLYKQMVLKIIYTYLNRSDINKDKDVISIFKRIIKLLYPDIVGRLSSMVSFDIATNLIMLRHSSDNELENASRVNNYIVLQNSNTMSIQTIINIYAILFSKITPMFESIMMVDVATKVNCSESTNIIFNNITQAILLILETLPDAILINVLKSYTNDWQMIMNKPNVRFSINDINPSPDNGFPRIRGAAELLKNNFNILVP